jgi:SulP family sulfate permease
MMAGAALYLPYFLFALRQVRCVSGVVGVTTIADWGLFFTPRSLRLLMPGVVIGCAMYVLLRRLRSPYALPSCMMAILVGFYSILLLSGTSLQEARDHGWIAPLSAVGEILCLSLV